MSDIEVARYALRTFKVERGDTELRSVAQSVYGSWHGGVCEAICTKEHSRHEAPVENCTCGVYGMLSIEQLFRQYDYNARNSVAVIAAEGISFIGDKGLRTQAARIVAYWCADMGPEGRHWPVYARQCPDAKVYTDINIMLGDYGFDTIDPAKLPAPYPLRYERVPRGDPKPFPSKIFEADILDWAEFDRRQALKKPRE